jgi:hypothetical protein
MLKSKTKKEKYNLFLNIIVGQLIVGTIGYYLQSQFHYQIVLAI